MSLLSVSELTHSFMETPLYRGAEFELFKGEHIGVVGPNGAGKSTFIKILLGEVVPDRGQVKWQSGIVPGHLDQYAEIDGNSSIAAYLRSVFLHLYEKEERANRLYEQAASLAADSSPDFPDGGAQEESLRLVAKAAAIQEDLEKSGFYEIENRIQKISYGLGLNAFGLECPVSQLSGGQRAKVILAKLLLENPDVLLLDEPTNFLDKEHVDWLASWLCSFEGAFIVVSHDHDFLEKISGGICDIEFGTIRKYHGNYTEFLKQKAHLREDYVRQYQAQQKQIEMTEAFIRKNKAGVNSKMARGRQKQLDRLERIAPPSFTVKPIIRIGALPLSASRCLTVNHLQVGYYYPLLPALSFSMSGGQKYVITGFNGIGKSTLLKTLLGQIPLLGGSFRFSEQVKIGYFEQDLVWDQETDTPFAIISTAYPKMNAKEIRRALAQFGLKDDDVLRPVRTLSGGEQSKVKLCRLFLMPCNFLILDEPTNHLDSDTKEVLKEAVAQFPGSVLLVSHEEKFYRGMHMTHIALRDG